ncbi:MAG: DUF5694 domain-containing protein [Acidobacteriota bacterium]
MLRRCLIAAAFILIHLAVIAQQPADAPISVIIVATFHMSNPHRDLHNVTAGDVLQPAAQAQIASVTTALAKFQPTAVMAEWSADVVNTRYADFLKGTLPPSHNEVVQLAFRLAQAAHLTHVYGIDADGDFPYEAVQAFAKSHDQAALLEQINAHTETMVKAEQTSLDTNGIPATLRLLNDPANIREGNFFYSQMLHIGSGADQPGATLLASWQHRNDLICANLIQNSHPGDHVVVFYGAGHAFLLRQCITQTPGFRLVEANDFLPK